MEIKTAIVYLYIMMNLFGLLLMKVDKTRAINHKYRISEKNLWMTALLGGAVGTTLGMRLFRHKTKHQSFIIGFPFLAVLELILFIYYCWAAFLAL